MLRLALLLGIFVIVRLAGAAVPPGKEPHGVPDTSPWQSFLAKYLDAGAPDGVNRVRYAAVTPAEKTALDAWLQTMQGAVPSTLAAPEQRAYWINLYNGQTISATWRACRGTRPPR